MSRLTSIKNMNVSVCSFVTCPTFEDENTIGVACPKEAPKCARAQRKTDGVLQQTVAKSHDASAEASAKIPKETASTKKRDFWAEERAAQQKKLAREKAADEWGRKNRKALLDDYYDYLIDTNKTDGAKLEALKARRAEGVYAKTQKAPPRKKFRLPFKRHFYHDGERTHISAAFCLLAGLVQAIEVQVYGKTEEEIRQMWYDTEVENQ